MNKTINFLGLLILLFSCVETKKSIYDLEKESLATGIIIDTITNNFFFGMSREQVDSVTLLLSIGDDFYFKIDEIRSLPFTVMPNFYNDSLYRISFLSYQNVHMYNSVFNLYNIKYGDPDTIIIGKNTIENYWLKGNLKIEVDKKEDDLVNWVSIEYSDIRRNTLDRSLIESSTEYFDYYTPEYYSLYKKNKVKALGGI